jgi:FixJ family two-component response regulator
VIRDATMVAVLDDDPSVRRALARLLRSAGYLVETFASARAFLERLAVRRPDCLLLDVSMPGQSGLDLHDRLTESGHDIPVIFITGHGDAFMAARATKAGAVAFLSKPVDDEALLRAVEIATATASVRPETS